MVNACVQFSKQKQPSCQVVCSVGIKRTGLPEMVDNEGSNNDSCSCSIAAGSRSSISLLDHIRILATCFFIYSFPFSNSCVQRVRKKGVSNSLFLSRLILHLFNHLRCLFTALRLSWCRSILLNVWHLYIYIQGSVCLLFFGPCFIFAFLFPLPHIYICMFMNLPAN